MFFKKKPTIHFRCLIEGVDQIMPVIPARTLQHPWMNAARADLAMKRKDIDYIASKNLHTAKCIGMFSVMRQGWVVRAWQDFCIETNGDGQSFLWQSPIDQKATTAHADYVGFHGPETFANYMRNWPSNTLRNIIKINSPWVAEIPKGYYLLEIPVAYSDENRFTTLTGMFDCDHGPASLNAQIMWHVMDGKTVIKAGTPLAQYVLVKKDEFDSEIHEYDPAFKKDSVRVLALNSRFHTNYKQLAKIFSKE